MSGVSLEVDGASESFDRVWVHVQDVKSRSVTYRAYVKSEFIDYVFDPIDKEDTVSWDQFLRDDVGTFVLSVYFHKMGQIAGATPEEERSRPRWVIASLDSVVDDEEGIELLGRAIDFDPNQFLA